MHRQQEARIIRFAPRPYAKLKAQIPPVLASHPETDKLILQCRQVTQLIYQIDRLRPGYALAIEHELQRWLHAASQGQTLP